MNPIFYVAPNVCGLKFDTTDERDKFWSALSDPVRSATERIAKRTLRFYPSKMADPGFQWPLKDGAATEQPKSGSAPVVMPQTDMVTTSPFANIAHNPTRPLPGLSPTPAPEMLASNQPVVEVKEPAAPQAPAPALSPTPAPDPEPSDKRTKQWKQWKARQPN